jgi:hypothetical protein
MEAAGIEPGYRVLAWQCGALISWGQQLRGLPAVKEFLDVSDRPLDAPF